MVDEHTLKVGTNAAYVQALKSFRDGGVPVGSALIVDGEVIAVGHNKRVQDGSNVLHGETDCIENAGHHFDLSKSVLFTTLSPCPMCAGAIVLFKIPVVVILDSKNTTDFETNVDFLNAKGVEVVDHPHEPSQALNEAFQTDPKTRPIWLGDVGI